MNFQDKLQSGRNDLMIAAWKVMDEFVFKNGRSFETFLVNKEYTVDASMEALAQFFEQTICWDNHSTVTDQDIEHVREHILDNVVLPRPLIDAYLGVFDHLTERQARTKILEDSIKEHMQLFLQWNGIIGYDEWFMSIINFGKESK